MGMVITAGSAGGSIPSSAEMGAMMDGANGVSSSSVANTNGFLVEYDDRIKSVIIGAERGNSNYSEFLLGPYGAPVDTFSKPGVISVDSSSDVQYVFLAATIEYIKIEKPAAESGMSDGEAFFKPFDIKVTELNTSLFPGSKAESPVKQEGFICIYKTDIPSGDKSFPHEMVKSGSAKYNIWIPLGSFVACESEYSSLSPSGDFTFVTPLYSGSNVIQLPRHKYAGLP